VTTRPKFNVTRCFWSLSLLFGHVVAVRLIYNSMMAGWVDQSRFQGMVSLESGANMV
jgi:hypothetical protein